MELENFGLIASRDLAGVRCFDAEAVVIARTAVAFSAYGIEPRHLKSLQHAAGREADLFGQVVLAAFCVQRNPEARKNATNQTFAGLGGRLGTTLRAAFIETELRKSSLAVSCTTPGQMALGEVFRLRQRSACRNPVDPEY